MTDYISKERMLHIINNLIDDRKSYMFSIKDKEIQKRAELDLLILKQIQQRIKNTIPDLIT